MPFKGFFYLVSIDLNKVKMHIKRVNLYDFKDNSYEKRSINAITLCRTLKWLEQCIYKSFKGKIQVIKAHQQCEPYKKNSNSIHTVEESHTCALASTTIKDTSLFVWC